MVEETSADFCVMVDANTAASDSATGGLAAIAALNETMTSTEMSATSAASSGTTELLTAAMTQCQLQFQQMLLAHTAGSTGDSLMLNHSSDAFLSNLLITGELCSAMQHCLALI